MRFMPMTGHIFIYGGIGTEAGEVSIANVKSQIEANKSASDYTVHIISQGGDVFEGYGIYNILKNTGKKIETHVEGLCASIATLVAFAGEKIVMNRTSEFMIHNPSISDLRGDARDIRNVADQLDKIKELLIDVSGRRAARNGKPISKEQLWALYDNETWLTAEQTKNEFGFADEVVDAIKAAAKINYLNFKKMAKETSIVDRITNLFKFNRFKNQATDTLEDGRVILVMTEDEDWTGKQVLLEDGSPLAAGTYKLASGKTITVDDQSVITQIGDAAPANAEPDKNQEMEKDNKIKELEAKLAEALAANQTATAEVATAKANTAKFQNRMDILEKEFNELKVKASATLGDQTPPVIDPNKRDGSQQKVDPMGDFALRHYKNQNII